MSENINLTAVNAEPDAGVKTFTQDDVNRIVSRRLTEEKDKRESDISQRETALKQKELDFFAKTKLAEMKLPPELLSILRYNDENELDQALTKFAAIATDYYGPENSNIPRLVSSATGADFTKDSGIRRAMGLE